MYFPNMLPRTFEAIMVSSYAVINFHLGNFMNEMMVKVVCLHSMTKSYSAYMRAYFYCIKLPTYVFSKEAFIEIQALMKHHQMSFYEMRE